MSGSEVVVDGDNLVITVPGSDGSEARNLGQTARLYIRPVLNSIPAQGAEPKPAPNPPAGAPPAPAHPARAGAPARAALPQAGWVPASARRPEPGSS